MEEKILVALFYLLARDAIPVGTLRRAVWQLADIPKAEDVVYSDIHLEGIARELARTAITGEKDEGPSCCPMKKTGASRGRPGH